jgi:GT2 family glycosyltransferase
VSVVTPVYNRIAITREFLQSMTDLRYPNYEIIIVDDGSTDGTANMVEHDFPSVRLIRTPGDQWWSKATNVGVGDALARDARYILTINDDVQVDPDFLTILVDVAEAHPRTLVGATIYEASMREKLWYAGGTMGWWTGQLLHRSLPDSRPLHWLTGMGTLIPAEVFREVGMYDHAHFPQYAADVDLTLRARRHGFFLAIADESMIWNKSDESVQLLIRRRVTPGNFFLPVVSRKSDAMLSMRTRLYLRHWPAPLIPIAFITYYMKFFGKQIIRLLRIRR